MPDESNEITLVRRASGGEREAFDELVRLHLAQATAVSVRLLGNRSDAAEVVQDAFLKAWRSLDTLQKPEAFAGWLMRIVTNLSLNKRRSRGLRKVTSIEDDESGTITDGVKSQSIGGEAIGSIDPKRIAEGKELGVELEKALALLPEKQRVAILLFTVQGQPQKQIAETLGCSVEAVKWHVFQGRKKLKEILKDYL
ncbi:MAG TPA: RNA polymerase sigma factor [Tepidisphaeraceae bacterium]|nr:RNA polymerase sigma factor [Tepidisphaeraceae bacterium]